MGPKRAKRNKPEELNQEKIKLEEHLEYFDKITKVLPPSNFSLVYKLQEPVSDKPWSELENLTLVDKNNNKLAAEQVVKTFGYDQLGVIQDKSTDLDSAVREKLVKFIDREFQVIEDQLCEKCKFILTSPSECPCCQSMICGDTCHKEKCIEKEKKGLGKICGDDLISCCPNLCVKNEKYTKMSEEEKRFKDAHSSVEQRIQGQKYICRNNFHNGRVRYGLDRSKTQKEETETQLVNLRRQLIELKQSKQELKKEYKLDSAKKKENKKKSDLIKVKIEEVQLKIAADDDFIVKINAQVSKLEKRLESEDFGCEKKDLSYQEAVSHIKECGEELYYCPNEMKYKIEQRTQCKGEELKAHLAVCLDSFKKCEKCQISYQPKNFQYRCEKGHYMGYIRKMPQTYSKVTCHGACGKEVDLKDQSTWFHHCEKCNFDICNTCIADRPKVPSSEFEHSCTDDLKKILKIEESHIRKIKQFKCISDKEDLYDVRCPKDMKKMKKVPVYQLGKNLNEKLRENCINGHPLEELQKSAYAGGFICNGCRERFAKDNINLHCKICQHDYCIDCMNAGKDCFICEETDIHKMGEFYFECSDCNVSKCKACHLEQTKILSRSMKLPIYNQQWMFVRELKCKLQDSNFECELCKINYSKRERQVYRYQARTYSKPKHLCLDCVHGMMLNMASQTVSSKNFGLLPVNSLKFLVPHEYKWCDVDCKLPSRIIFKVMFLTEGEMFGSFKAAVPKSTSQDCLSWSVSTNSSPDHCFHQGTNATGSRTYPMMKKFQVNGIIIKPFEIYQVAVKIYKDWAQLDINDKVQAVCYWNRKSVEQNGFFGICTADKSQVIRVMDMNVSILKLAEQPEL